MARTSGSMVKEIMRTLRMVRLRTRKARTWAKKANLEIEETWLLFPVLLLISCMFSRDFAMPLDGQGFTAIIRVCGVLSLLLFPNISDCISQFSIVVLLIATCIHILNQFRCLVRSSKDLFVLTWVFGKKWKTLQRRSGRFVDRKRANTASQTQASHNRTNVINSQKIQLITK